MNTDKHFPACKIFSSFRINGAWIACSMLFLAACSPGSARWRIDKDWEDLIAKERTEPGAVLQLDSSVITFMRAYDVPGLSIAVTKNDSLVYAKGYGFADMHKKEKVDTRSLFRLASVSKPVTSVAIMKLIREGKLSMQSKIFGDSGILGNMHEAVAPGPAITDITIDELLHHISGGWTNDEQDPMFSNPTFGSSQLLSWTLKNQPLKNTPGTAYAYSNFGYFLLGRVIEKITGRPYADYVIENILKPAGISDMQVGNNTINAKKPHEVVYYGQSQDPYGFNLSRMDAHGGWIASATDLLRLITRIDGVDLKKDILDSAAIATMLTPSSANSTYACGWISNNKFDNWFHMGSLPGTASELAHTKQGFSWAILVNTRSVNEHFDDDLDRILWNAISDPATRWPVKDLF